MILLYTIYEINQSYGLYKLLYFVYTRMSASVCKGRKDNTCGPNRTGVVFSLIFTYTFIPLLRYIVYRILADYDYNICILIQLLNALLCIAHPIYFVYPLYLFIADAITLLEFIVLQRNVYYYYYHLFILPLSSVPITPCGANGLSESTPSSLSAARALNLFHVFQLAQPPATPPPPGVPQFSFPAGSLRLSVHHFFSNDTWEFA